ncbi:MAG TPA: hypothetical protein DCX25_03160 [Candidatus Pacebacteria bacterium]|nr:hypothetical protein [Candidatus Paceibacterota bacterium]HCR11020.1 hypothetical protein [Candidatus Paceibacterota bacterium]HCR92450.1 hypothetical protein [Candidatus Paceibacterota bacterium]
MVSKIKKGLVAPSKRSGKLKMVKHLQNRLQTNLLSQEIELHLKNNRIFSVEEFFKKNDGAVDSSANKDQPTHFHHQR